MKYDTYKSTLVEARATALEDHGITYDKRAFAHHLNVMRDSGITFEWNSVSDPVLRLGMMGTPDGMTKGMGYPSIDEIEHVKSVFNDVSYAIGGQFTSSASGKDLITLTHLGSLWGAYTDKDTGKRKAGPFKMAVTLAHELRHRAFKIISNTPEIRQHLDRLAPEWRKGGKWHGGWGDTRNEATRSASWDMGKTPEHAMIYSLDLADPMGTPRRADFFTSSNFNPKDQPISYWRGQYDLFAKAVTAFMISSIGNGKGVPSRRPTGSAVPAHRKLPNISDAEMAIKKEQEAIEGRWLLPSLQKDPIYREMFNRIANAQSTRDVIGGWGGDLGLAFSAINTLDLERGQASESWWFIRRRMGDQDDIFDFSTYRNTSSEYSQSWAHSNGFRRKIDNLFADWKNDTAIKGNWYKTPHHVEAIIRELESATFKDGKSWSQKIAQEISTHPKGIKNPLSKLITNLEEAAAGDAIYGMPSAWVQAIKNGRLKNNQPALPPTPEQKQNPIKYLSYDHIKKDLQSNPEHDPFRNVTDETGAMLNPDRKSETLRSAISPLPPTPRSFGAPQRPIDKEEPNVADKDEGIIGRVRGFNPFRKKTQTTTGEPDRRSIRGGRGRGSSVSDPRATALEPDRRRGVRGGRGRGTGRSDPRATQVIEPMINGVKIPPEYMPPGGLPANMPKKVDYAWTTTIRDTTVAYNIGQLILWAKHGIEPNYITPSARPQADLAVTVGTDRNAERAIDGVVGDDRKTRPMKDAILEVARDNPNVSLAVVIAAVAGIGAAGWFGWRRWIRNRKVKAFAKTLSQDPKYKHHLRGLNKKEIKDLAMTMLSNPEIKKQL